MGVKVLESEMDSLTGKENKKARNAKSREIAELKKDANFMDAERILVGKEPITPSNKTPQNSKPKGGEYDDLFASADAGKNYVAAVSTELVFTSEKEAKKEATGKKGDPKEIEKLRQDIEDYKAKLKEEFGYTKQEINKDPDLMDMQKRFKEIGGK